jgi:hypothetical protein
LIVELDLVQAFDAVEIDQVMRLRQTEIHQRHETLPPASTLASSP